MTPFKNDPRLELIASQLRAGWPVSMKDTLEADAYMERKQAAMEEAGLGQWFMVTHLPSSKKTFGELAFETVSWACALGMIGLALWGLFA